MSKELPILFSTSMVQALLAGRKTMTRRIVKGGFDPNQYSVARMLTNDQTGDEQAFFFNKGDKDCWGIPPKYQPGHIMYVRESYYQQGNWRQVPGAKTKGGRMKWEFVPANKDIVFEAPSEYRKGRHSKDPETIAWHKRLGRFMPRKYARIWLECTGVKVERVQDISQEDAKSEGVGDPCPHRPSSTDCKKHADGSLKRDCYVCAFRHLWDKINGPLGHQCDSNEWVFGYSFRILSTVGRPEIK